MCGIRETANPLASAQSLATKLFAMCGVALLFGLFCTGPGGAQEPMAARKTQGSGIKLTLTRKFIDDFADVATIESDFRVDGVSKIHKPEDDGEVHIGGVAAAAKLATVAELTNPQEAMVRAIPPRSRRTVRPPGTERSISKVFGDCGWSTRVR